MSVDIRYFCIVWYPTLYSNCVPEFTFHPYDFEDSSWNSTFEQMREVFKKSNRLVLHPKTDFFGSEADALVEFDANGINVGFRAYKSKDVHDLTAVIKWLNCERCINQAEKESIPSFPLECDH